MEAKAVALQHIVSYHFSNFDCDSIFIVGKDVVRFMRSHQMYDRIFFVKERMVTRHIRQRNFITALHTIRRAYDDAQATQDISSIVQALSLMANVYRNLSLYEQAFSFYTQALNLANSNRPAITQMAFFVRQYYELAWTTRLLNKPNETLRLADNLAVEIARLREENSPTNVQLFYFFELFHRAIAYAQLEQPQHSLQAIRRAETIYDPQWDERSPYFAVKFHDMWGIYYLAISNYSRAIKHFNLLLDYYSSLGGYWGMLMSLNFIARAYFQSGDYRAASNMFLRIQNKQDAQNRERFHKQHNELRTIFELDRAEFESKKRSLIIQRQQFTIVVFFVVFAALLLTIFLVVWFLMQKKRKLKSLYLQIKEKDHLHACMDTLVKQDQNDSLNNLKSENSPISTIANNLMKHKKIVVSLNEYLSKHYCFEDPDTNLSAEEITTFLATNRTDLFHAVKTVTGKTLHDYISEFQIERARQMLETSQESIEQIAILCGYKDRSTLYRQFFKRYSMSPTQYRQMARNSS